MKAAADRQGREFLYRDYRLFVVAWGRGWRVLVHAPGSAYADPETPSTEDAQGLERVLAEARSLVDTRLSPARL
jgi:hypothetical protein